MDESEKPAKLVKISDARISPPAGLLTKDQERLWWQIVDSLPADFFRPGDVPLLAAYCKAWSFYLMASAQIEENGIVLEDARGRSYANPAQSMVVTQASAMAQLSVKLRLSPSSRIQPRTAGSQAAQPTGKRPWSAGS